MIPLLGIGRQKNVWCTIAAGVVTSATLFWAVLAFSDVLTGQEAVGSDYIQYWAVGKQSIGGANPSKAGAILLLQQSAGSGGSLPRVSLSPFILPFTFLSHIWKASACLPWSLVCEGKGANPKCGQSCFSRFP